MRKFNFCVISFVTVLSLHGAVQAEIKSLPPTLKTSAPVLQSAHNDGVGVFFRSLEENCDGHVVLDNKFFRSSRRAGAIALFRIESRVEANCLSKEIWQCRSVFEGTGQNTKFTYKYTDCGTDAPLIED